MKWVMILIIVACNAAGDLLNSRGMKLQGEVRDFRPSGIARLIAALGHNRYVIAGIAVMAAGFIAQMWLLSIADLSFAIPATASGYFFETLLARIVLGEQVTALRWIGAALVAAGVTLLQF
jgi:drug/metabolite transporter (DMT)-like permease